MIKADGFFFKNSLSKNPRTSTVEQHHVCTYKGKTTTSHRIISQNHLRKRPLKTVHGAHQTVQSYQNSFQNTEKDSPN